MTISGIILAGGGSRRMGGINKALLQVGGRPIVERAAIVLREILPEVLLITNSPQEYEFLGLPMFRDLIPGRGALGGLYTGLNKCSSDRALLVGCDMPFLNKAVVSYMIKLAQTEYHDILIPRVKSKLQPMHAIYSRRCLVPIEDHMNCRDLRILDFFHLVDVQEIPETDLYPYDPDCRFVMNINTPRDLERAREMV
ncbi:MAG: molybdenum cofactor guanylyltransferase [Desulfomonilaceae bacterium]|nr:molybdenum cofactor guanylyltransferase [Desulfomonilaceae bacterium]